ncbi:MAG: hypothetical protein RI947_317 [Candidatus Parcubacteria bacterium]|jgi:hypothetical protein
MAETSALVRQTNDEYNREQDEALIQRFPEYSFYPETQRVKLARFDSVSSPIGAAEDAWGAWEAGKDTYATPLVQVRAVLPLADQDELAARVQELQDAAAAEGAHARIAGRIPLTLNDEAMGLYYVHIESADRPAYQAQSAHTEAVQRGIEKKNRYVERALPPGFTTHAVEFARGGAFDILEGQELDINIDTLAEAIAGVHRLAFEYPHDPAQQTTEGARAILERNPVLIAVDHNRRQLASVAYLERDDRFTLGNIALVEPTYFTHPGEEYRRHGLSSHLRQATQALTRQSGNISVYNGSPMLVFNESIRDTSFPLAIANSSRLAATHDLRIDGNLGDTYTAIGPANPDIGYMPMGLTYFPDPRIDMRPSDNFGY